MKVDLVKGDYRYDALMVVWNFLKLYGEPENTDEYWHEALDWARKNATKELEQDLIVTVVHYFDEEFKKNERV